MIYDAIIVGSGAGGGTIARQLALAGWNILIIERGGFLPREKENWDAEEVFQKGRYSPNETWLDKDEKPFVPGTHYYVGGNTKFYGAALLRLRERDFEEVEHYGGISPAWPLKYKDFKLYYQRAEELFEVHGARGEDPLEPPEEKPYPYPAVSHEPIIANIYSKLKKEGLKPFHLPLGIRLNEKHRENSLCIRCDTCDGYPCLADAKSDAHHICIAPILKLPNVHLLTNTKVERLIAKNNEIAEVETDTGKRFQAKRFIVSCGAINSAALLLRSELANRSGQVGRHYMCHNNSAIVALSKEKNNVTFQKTIGINDFYFGAEDSKLPLGHIQLLGKVKGAMLAGDAPWFTPKFATEWMADHAIGWWITSEDLPNPNSRVMVKGDQIHLHYQPTNLEAHKRLLKKLKMILNFSGHRIHFPMTAYLAKKIPIAGVAHQVGTCRFGHDSHTSVLDIHCKAHDLKNLYVVDGSFFPSAGAVNPALTIIANALRVADHLIATS
ncbi:MAG: GMC family oxidoreductase [Parachlamydiales bacterium]|nr:GMC family oxidoreductase [Parachlamydiales bacterium]